MQHSDFERPTEGTGTGAARSVSRDDLTARIAEALNHGDHQTAGSLLRNGLERFPDDNRLLQLEAKQRKQEDRFTRVHALLKETREAIEDDAFVRAVGAFREAANLSQGFADLEDAVFDVAVEEAQQLGDRNWRVARSLLEEASRLNARLIVADQLWERVRAAEREETIANVLAETALAKPEDLERARERLTRTLEQYPNDSGLVNRLKSIESTIEEKRKWDERQGHLRKLMGLQAALQREEDPAEAGKYVRLSESAASPFGAEPEFSSVIEDIRHQVISCEKAAAALETDRIDDCLEECAWVLSRMRHHQLFLKFKQKAEARELALVDEYSTAVSRIREFLDAGELAKAGKLCADARAKLPQFTDFLELSREIEQRTAEQHRNLQENVESARRLVERGDRSLRARQFRATEQSFGNALKLLPGDENLAAVVLGILHGYARSVAHESAELAEEALSMSERLLPGSVVPVDLTEALCQAREQEKEEAIRWSALNVIGVLDAQAELAKRREQLIALRDEARRNNFASAGEADVRGATVALFSKIDDKLEAVSRKQARQLAIFKMTSLAAAVIFGLGFVYWLKDRAPSLLRSKAGVETIVLTKPASTPATVAKGPEAAKPAILEIRGAEAGTEVKLDGDSLGTFEPKEVFAKELAAGEHSIELSRRGYRPKTLSLSLAPGDALVLTGGDMRLESLADGAVASVQPSLKQLSSKPSFATIQGLDAKSYDGFHAKAATPSAEELQWQSVDKGNPDSLRAFIAKFPASALANQAKKELDGVLMAHEAKAEDGDWSNANHENKSALEDFLRKHPGGRHSAAATNALAELERKARAAEAQSLEEAAWKRVDPRDEGALESYLRGWPASRYRNEAEAALAALRLSEASKNDTVAVLTVISRFASAWNTKDLDSILAIQKNLNKRTVKAELSHVKELNMQISPASPPQIDGAQAVVLCRRQASQVFSDGTRKQIPETIVSYVLEKHDGNWTIEGTR